MDAGLAKAASSPVGLSTSTYKTFRRKLEVFERQCRRRGQDCVVEGAYLVLSTLEDVAWDATEMLDLDAFEANDPFAEVRRVLDGL